MAPRSTIQAGAVHEMDFEARQIGYRESHWAPASLLSGDAKEALFKQLRKDDPKRMKVVEQALSDAGDKDQLSRRQPLVTDYDEKGMIHAVATVIVAIGHDGKIKGTMASRRVTKKTSKKNGALVYMGSPSRDELKEALYKDTKALYMIDAAVLWNTQIAWVEAAAIDTLKDGLGFKIAPQSRELSSLRRLEMGHKVPGKSLTQPRKGLSR